MRCRARDVIAYNCTTCFKDGTVPVGYYQGSSYVNDTVYVAADSVVGALVLVFRWVGPGAMVPRSTAVLVQNRMMSRSPC